MQPAISVAFSYLEMKVPFYFYPVYNISLLIPTNNLYKIL